MINHFEVRKTEGGPGEQGNALTNAGTQERSFDQQ
jgi:hypothetical protein